MQRYFLVLFIVLIGLGGTACAPAPAQLQGGSEFGNPPKLRAVQGRIGVDGTGESDCAADEVLIADRLLNLWLVSVDVSCEFHVALRVDKTYSFELLADDEPLAQILFEAEPNAEPTPFLKLAESPLPLDLGNITIEITEAGAVAYADINENQAEDQVADADSEGTLLFGGEEVEASATYDDGTTLDTDPIAEPDPGDTSGPTYREVGDLDPIPLFPDATSGGRDGVTPPEDEGGFHNREFIDGDLSWATP